MEIDEDKEIWWRKLGGGTFRLNRGKRGKIIKPNEKFLARPSEIPEATRDLIKPLQELPEEPPIKAEKFIYTMKYAGGNRWNIVNEQEKIFNEKLLTKEEAQNLMTKLNE